MQSWHVRYRSKPRTNYYTIKHNHILVDNGTVNEKKKKANVWPIRIIGVRYANNTYIKIEYYTSDPLYVVFFFFHKLAAGCCRPYFVEHNNRIVLYAYVKLQDVL